MKNSMKTFLKRIIEKKKFILEIFVIIIISLYAFSLAPKTFQNDIYYTIPIGNLIMENGIDMKDHFSWHEDLPYTYPHWLYDVIMAKIYNLKGWDAVYYSVCILSIILGITIYIVNKKLNKNQINSFMITIGSLYMLKSYITARAQLLTFIIFMIIIYLIEKFIENPKKLVYGVSIIICSTLIANLHVAVWPFLFVLSLPYIAEGIVGCVADFIIYRKFNIFLKKFKLKLNKKNKEKTLKIKEELDNIYISNEKRKEYRENTESYKIKLDRNKNIKWLFLLMLICAFTGLITPLGRTPYTYLYNTMQGNTTKNINEHLPLTLINNTPMMCTLIILISSITFTKVKIKLRDLFMLGGLCYLMFLSKRQSTMFILIGSIILNRIITEIIEIYSKEKIGKSLKTLLIVTICFFTCCYSIICGIKNIKNKKNSSYISKSSYPVQAADWILENLDVNNIKLFNEYNYGSYLLFKGIPVFIDSRADLYAPEFNENDNIFMEFINTSGIGKYYGSTFEKYGITHIILYKNSKVSMLIDKADSEKYNKLYSDDYFVIYEVVKK